MIIALPCKNRKASAFPAREQARSHQQIEIDGFLTTMVESRQMENGSSKAGSVTARLPKPIATDAAACTDHCPKGGVKNY